MSAIEQARKALAHFAVDCEDAAIEPFGQGHINDSFIVAAQPPATAAKRYLLQRFNAHVFQQPSQVIENMQRVCEHLRAAVSRRAEDPEHRVLQLLPTRTGEWCWHGAGGTWRLMPLIERAHAASVITNPEQAYQAALAYGRFQADLVDLPGPPLHETIPHFHDTPRRFDALERAIAADNTGRAQQCRAEIDFAMACRDRAGVLLSLRSSGAIPQRVVHNDAKLSNVLLDESSGRALCVVDLDTVMPGLSLFDFGDMVRTMATCAREDEPDASRVRVEIELFQALARGYLEAAGGFLTQLEREHLATAGWVITLEQAVRFLTDWLEGDRYYTTTGPEQNLHRTRTQLSLLRSIEEQEDQLRDVSR